MRTTDAVLLRSQPVPLERETRAVLTTPEAAFHLNRRPQTLRLWSMRDNGPICPLRVNGRFAWSVAENKRVLGGGMMLSPKPIATDCNVQKRTATQIARFALAGYAVHRVADGGFMVCRWDQRTHYCRNLDELCSFAEQVGAP